MKINSMVAAVTESMSIAGTSMVAQKLAKEYTQSLIPQVKINIQTVQSWHKGYKPDIKPWSKLNTLGLKGMARMYSHGIKRV